MALRLAVGVERGRGVAGRLERLERPGVDPLELARLEVGGGAERGGARVVLGDHRDDALGAVGGALGDERADLGVLARPHRLRQGRVGDVADQHVLERVLALAGEPAAGGRARPGPSPAAPRAPPARSMRSSRAGSPASPPRRSGRRPRRAGARGAPARGSESSRAASTECTVSGSASASRPPSSTIRLTISSANSGLPPERSATCSTSWRPAAGRLAGQQRATSSRACSWASGLERDRGRVQPAAAPARPAVEQLVAGQADDQHRARAPSAPGTRSGRACPRRPSGCPRPRTPAAGGRWRPRPACAPPRTAGRASAAGPRARPRRSPSPFELGAALDPERPARAPPRPAPAAPRCRSVGEQRLDPAAELAPGGRRVVGVDDLEAAADDLAERPVGEPGAVGRAAAEPHRGLAGRALPTRVVSSRSSRDLPTPAWPITVTRCGRDSRTTRS